MVWLRRHAQRRNSRTRGAASYHPLPRRLPGSATAHRRTTVTRCGAIRQRDGCTNCLRPCAVQQVEQRLGGNLDQATQPHHWRRP